MIVKKIHYCWFGGNPMSKLLLECIESWKKHCPDFEIIEWNEFNSKVYSNAFYRNALRKKRYAFVADYVRAAVLLEYGGIYMDTDMLLLKPIDVFLNYDFFIGEEIDNRINFALFGSIKNHRFLEQMVTFYNTTEFNNFSPPVITHTFSPIINYNTIEGTKEVIFKPDFFYCLPYENRLEDYVSFCTENSVAVHLWDHSWKVAPKSNFKTLFKNWREVVSDFLFYHYSYNYFRRYFKEFSRKMYHLLKSKL